MSASGPSPHLDSPGIRLDQAVEHLEECSLACAVSADEAEAFPAAEFEGDVIDGVAQARGRLKIGYGR